MQKVKKLLLALTAVLCSASASWAGIDLTSMTKDYGRVMIGQDKTLKFNVSGSGLKGNFWGSGDMTMTLSGDPDFTFDRYTVPYSAGLCGFSGVYNTFKPQAVGYRTTHMHIADAKNANTNTADFFGYGIVNFTASPLVYNGIRVQVPGVAMSEEHLNAPVTGTSMTVRQMVGGYKTTVSGNGVNLELTAADFNETLTTAPLQPGTYSVKVELVPSTEGTAEWSKFEPYCDAVSTTLQVAAPALDCRFDAQGQLSAEPVLFETAVDAPASYAGNTAKWPVKIEAANQYTYRFKPQMGTMPGSEEATDFSYAYLINNQPVAADLLSYDDASGLVTIQQLPVDAATRANRAMSLQVVASYKVADVLYTAVQNFDIPTAEIQLYDMFTPSLVSTKAIATKGYYQGEWFNVYSLNLAFNNIPARNTPYYYMGGFTCDLAPDFYTSTPPEGFADNVYGLAGSTFDRSPRMAYNGDSQTGIPGYEYFTGNWTSANNWARLMAENQQIGIILPHFFAQPLDGTAEVSHGAASISFRTYYPVVYDARYDGADAGRVVNVMETPSNSLNFNVQGGTVQPDDVITGIADITAGSAPEAVYNLQGIRVGTADQLRTLPDGLYIVGGRKVAVGK